jgi:hypothetical protein
MGAVPGEWRDALIWCRFREYILVLLAHETKVPLQFLDTWLEGGMPV